MVTLKATIRQLSSHSVATPPPPRSRMRARSRPPTRWGGRGAGSYFLSFTAISSMSFQVLDSAKRAGADCPTIRDLATGVAVGPP
jgi:hypothetical protein